MNTSLLGDLFAPEPTMIRNPSLTESSAKKYLAVGISFAAASLLARIFLLDRRRKQLESQSGGCRLPPFPPAGFFETGKSLSGGKLPWFFLDCAKSVGNIFQLKVPIPGGMYVVGDAKLQQKILEDPNTLKPEEIYEMFNFVFNGYPTVLTTEGMAWKQRIKAVSPAFASSHIRRMTKVCEDFSKRWINDRLGPFAEGNIPFDIGEEMVQLTVSIIAEAAFEYKMSQSEAQSYVEEMSIALCEYRNRSSDLLHMVFGSWWSSAGRRGILAMKRLHDFARNVIEAYRESHEMDKTVCQDKTLIHCIMNNKGYTNDDERAADITVFFLAGHDTTGNSIAWTLLELAKNQKEMQNLREELSSLPPEEWVQAGALQNAIKEGMRLHPVIAGGPVRKTGRSFVCEQQNIVIPKGSQMLLPNILSGRDSTVFPQPDKYIPSRWNKSVAWNRGFFPFATGRHSCPGQALANAEIPMVIARVIMTYHLDVEDEGTAIFDATTLKPVGAKLKARRLK